jgi:hypothetical protein
MTIIQIWNCAKSILLRIKVIGKPFNDSVFIVSATTNTAAAQIKGDKAHSIAGLRKKCQIFCGT